MGLGQVLEIAKAADALQLLATTGAGQNTTAGPIPVQNFTCIVAAAHGRRYALALGLCAAAGILLGLLPHRSGARPKKMPN